MHACCVWCVSCSVSLLCIHVLQLQVVLQAVIIVVTSDHHLDCQDYHGFLSLSRTTPGGSEVSDVALVATEGYSVYLSCIRIGWYLCYCCLEAVCAA